jgi:PadR family transcriptional regulator AphA
VIITAGRWEGNSPGQRRGQGLSARTPLTTTSYAVLGLFSIRPWSSYELTQQMDRSLGRIWPRAVSKLYEEPKKLASHGLARSATQHNGQRTRTVYTITANGRRARCWSSSSS